MPAIGLCNFHHDHLEGSGLRVIELTGSLVQSLNRIPTSPDIQVVQLAATL